MDRVTSEDFLSGRGLGNEIPFYAFDYPPEEERAIREHIRFLLQQLPGKRPGIKVAHVNLLELVTSHLKERKLYAKAVALQRKKGDGAALKALKAPLDAEKIARVFTESAQPARQDLVLVSGVGSVYPLLRTHSLLNNLHASMRQTPLVMFYPGRYDGQSLRLFGLLKDKPYYRAFRLVD
jgi:hypothetical protein